MKGIIGVRVKLSINEREVLSRQIFYLPLNFVHAIAHGNLLLSRLKPVMKTEFRWSGTLKSSYSDLFEQLRTHTIRKANHEKQCPAADHVCVDDILDELHTRAECRADRF